jgi:hypothetical protein
MTFSSKKKVTKYFLFIFIFHICAKFQTRKKDSSWHVYLNVFNNIVTYQFVLMMGAITIFGESIFIFSFVIMD